MIVEHPRHIACVLAVASASSPRGGGVTAVNPDASQQTVVEAALVLLERMGLSPADLTAVPPPRKPVPTFAEYVPVVAAVVSDGTRRAYGSYWNRIIEHFGLALVVGAYGAGPAAPVPPGWTGSGRAAPR
jgi:hypothetical protein